MANNTVFRGFVPECSLVSADDFDSNAAVQYTPYVWGYYQDKLGAWLPGAILAGVALLGFTVQLIWALSLRCRHHAWKWELQYLPGALTEKAGPRRSGKLGNILITTFYVAVLGLAVWGIVESILTTNRTIPDFWDIVYLGRDRVQIISNAADAMVRALSGFNDALQSLIGLSTTPDTGVVEPSTQTVGNDTVVLGPVTTRVVLLAVGAVSTVAQQIQPTVQSVLGVMQDSANSIREVGLDGIQRFINAFYPPMNKVDNTWRFVIIIVLFSLVILFATTSALLAMNERTPRSANVSNLLLWLTLALLLALGAGAIGAGNSAARDGCLYTESLVLREVNNRVANPDRIVQALRFYFDPSSTVGNIADQLYNVNTTAITSLVSGIEPIGSFLNSTDGQTLISRLPMQSQVQQQLQQWQSTVASLLGNQTLIEQTISKTNIQQIYREGKQYICCPLVRSVKYLYISWTATGCAGLVLAFFCAMKVAAMVTMH